MTNDADEFAVLRPYLPRAEAEVIRGALRGEGAQWFRDKIRELAETIRKMPRTYDQSQVKDAVASLHYFTPAHDFYILELDMEGSGREQAFALSFNSGSGDSRGRLGYVSIDEIVRAGAELDLHFDPKTVSEIRRERMATHEDSTPRAG